MAYNSKNRTTKAEATRRKIYESAEKLFSTNNIDKVSVDSIVELAGVAKGSFYVHFPSKNALIATLINDHVENADMDYKSFLHTFPEDTPAQVIILSLIDKIADVLTNGIGYEKMRAVYQAQITKNVDTHSVISYNRDLYKLFGQVLEKGIERGEFKTQIPLDLLTKHFIMAIRGVTYEWCIRYPDFDFKTLAIQHFELLIEGLKG